jgi:hypothetical protein
MPSRSRTHWEDEARRALDEFEPAHAVVGGVGRGRRLATQQVKLAYAVMLSSHFQGFCRDLHSEAVDHLTAHLDPPPMRLVVKRQFIVGRKLDTGNPNPGNLGADFGRIGLDLWPGLLAQGSRTQDHRRRLDELGIWRNAIAHHDFDPTKLGGRKALGLADVRRWRSACAALVRSMDALVRAHLVGLVGVAPWT